MRALRREDQRAKNGGLNPQQATVAAAVYVLSGYDLLVAGSYVGFKAKNTFGGLEDLGYMIRDKCLAMPLDSLLRLELPESEKDAAVRETALKFIAEQKTLQYIYDTNESKGVAPSSFDAAAEYIRQCDNMGSTTSNPGLRRALENGHAKPQSSKRCIRKWSQTFRCNWGLGFGSLRTRNPIPEAELLEKAGGVMITFYLRSCRRPIILSSDPMPLKSLKHKGP